MASCRKFACLLSVLVSAFLLDPNVASAANSKRLALVIGNDAYQYVSKLEKAGNDATAMARELKVAGFEVTLERDQNYKNMVKKIDFFIRHISGGDQVVVFYAGHGVQLRSGSYLLPVDIEASSESEIEKTSYALNDLMDKLNEAKASFTLVIVDACRDNPLKSNGRSLGTSLGLLPPDPPKGQMVVYSASKGQQALDKLSDKDNNPNGVFTREFISRMKKPGIRIEDLVREVQDAVEDLARTIGHDQRPAIYNEARGEFYFYGPTAEMQPTSNPARTEKGRTKEQIEDQFWDGVKSSGDVRALEAYMKSYPSGRYIGLATMELNKMKSNVMPGQSNNTKNSDNAVAQTMRKGKNTKDCPFCPDMVLIPIGVFIMGYPNYENERKPNEGPTREVNINAPIYISKYEVTRAEYSYFVSSTGYETDAEKSDGCIQLNAGKYIKNKLINWKSPGFEQSDLHPAVCISWNDAQAYVTWLNLMNPGKNFGLLSEALWEYAARAGKGSDKFPWGNDEAFSEICNWANGMDIVGKSKLSGISWDGANCKDGYATTAPGDAYKPNDFGLYNMHGNAWEWVQDQYHPNYEGAPTDGRAWEVGGTGQRVLRGGSWNVSPWYLGSADRVGNPANYRDISTGFRIMRRQ